jgi:hypothetical protein
MNADDVVRVVLDRLGSGMPVVDMTTELAGVLVDISSRAEFLTAVNSIETVAGQAEYAQPDNLKSVYEVSIDGGAVLERKTFRQYLQFIDSGSASGEPANFTLRHENLYLWPVPDMVYTINVDSSIYHPAAFTDILFGPEFHEAIFEGTLAAIYTGKLNRELTLAQRSLDEAEALTLKFYEDYPQAKLHAARYEQEIAKLMGNMEVETETVLVEYRDI